MTSAATVVGEARAATGLSRAAFARLAAVAPSTISRIERGELDPTWGVISSILASAGFAASYPLKSAGDPSAATAGQAALGAPVVLDEDAQQWLTRWIRAGIVDAQCRAKEPATVGLLAGIASRIANRPGARGAIAYDGNWAKIQSRFDGAGIDYEVTGVDALEGRIISANPTVYVGDIDAALASADPAAPGERRVILVEMKAQPGKPRRGFVDRTRALIDAYAAAGRNPDRADAYAAEFSAPASP